MDIILTEEEFLDIYATFRVHYEEGLGVDTDDAETIRNLMILENRAWDVVQAVRKRHYSESHCSN
jgi:hypothetical protein